MNLFFRDIPAAPGAAKKTAAGLKKTELRLGIWEYRCGELQKRLLNRQGAFLSFNNASACRSLFVRNLCGLSSSSLPAAQYPYPFASIPFLAHRYRPRYKKIPFSDTSGVDPSCYTERLPEESVAGQIENGVFVPQRRDLDVGRRF